MSADAYEQLEETLEILKDEDTLLALRESEEDVRAGRVFALEAVRRELGLA
jgi:PHD/YefM family antitoxin component YafN of YafNO toxin-antitoxin module